MSLAGVHSHPPAWPWRRGLLWLAGLAPLFYLSYGLANYLAGLRAPLPSIVFGWERQIPFLPWTIFPYWSINAFYGLSLLLAPTRHELDRHGARLLTAQAIAVSCFLLWPLGFSFGQPAVQGAPAWLFNALRGFDQPYNQAPSLHIALAVILWDFYQRRVQAPGARVLLHGWALLICVSVLTTFQHHFIDIPTGAALGLLCVWLWPLERRVAPARAWRLTADPVRLRLAAVYAGAGLICLCLAWGLAGGGAGRTWEVALLLAWPALSLMLVALNYLGWGERGFQMDRHGRMAWAARWLYAPYRLGAWVNAWAWTRGLPVAHEVSPGVWLGRLPSRAQWLSLGRPAVLSVSAELQVPAIVWAGGAAQVPVVCVPMLDLVVPRPAQLRWAAAVLHGVQAGGGPVLVCCALGFSRSAAVLVCWLVRAGRCRDVAQAVAQVRAQREAVVLRPAVLSALMRAAAPSAEPMAPLQRGKG